MSDNRSPIDLLQRLMQPAARPRPGERCDMCATDIGDEHSHVVKLDTRSLLCTCRPCYLLFDFSGAGGMSYRAVPERYLSFPGFALTEGEWDSLQIPVGMAFLFYNSGMEQTVGFYPSPAGATECTLPLDAWASILDTSPSLATLQPDVEALLLRASPAEAFLVPIDACYELVGHLRMLWRGFDGGAQAHQQVEAFFDRVRQRAKPAPAPA